MNYFGHVILSLFFAISIQAQTGNNRNVSRLMDKERGVKMALSAAPDKVVSGCTLYLLEAQGYVVVRAGSSGFSCIVERDEVEHPQSVWPICYDPGGTRTILPLRLYVAELRAQGKTDEEIDSEVGKGCKNGKFRARFGLFGRESVFGQKGDGRQKGDSLNCVIRPRRVSRADGQGPGKQRIDSTALPTASARIAGTNLW